MIESFLRGKIRKVISFVCQVFIFSLMFGHAACLWSGLCEIDSPQFIIAKTIVHTWALGYLALRATLIWVSMLWWKFEKDEGHYLSICWPVAIWFAPWIISKFETERKLRLVGEVMGA